MQTTQMQTVRVRYSDAELAEFKKLIIEKIKSAEKHLNQFNEACKNGSPNGTEDTSPTFKPFDDASLTLSKESNSQSAIRQEKFIRSLKNALVRIENKTYGICRVTGKLIPKERLKLVPHTTLSVEAKINRDK
jgi:RNA polymerase-binding transcription factor DksA